VTDTPDWNQVRSTGEKVFEDLGYYAQYKVFDYRIEFTVYGLAYLEPPWLYQGEMGPVMTLEEAVVALTGTVKWDGCSDWDFKTDECLQHFCERDHLIEFGELLARLWDLGRLIPHWSE